MGAELGTFGRYRLVEELGTGGMAVVYRAVVDGPEGFSRQVVVKRVLPHLASNPKFVKMFLAEARLSALLHHPAIVQVHDLGQVGDDYFLAMEFVEGHDLVTVLHTAAERGRPMPEGVAVHIALAVAEALAYAHAAKDKDGRPLEIVHRDVSPSNIMVTVEGAVKLLDFGIARVASHARVERTRTGTLKGKIGYMSPEQADAQKDIDGRSDLFALGVVLWECLTGTRLFRGDDDLEKLRLVRECVVWPPSSVRPDLEPELDAVVMKLLQRTREGRYQTGDEVAAALQPLVHRYEGSAAALREYLRALGPPRRPGADDPAMVGTTPAKRSASPSPAPRGTLTGSQGELTREERALVLGAGARRRRVIGGGIGLGVVGVGALLLGTRWPRTPAIRPPEPPPIASKAPPPVETKPLPATPAAPPPAVVAKVRLAVRAPRGATVQVDGRDLGPAPIDVELERIATSRTVVVHLAGHHPFTSTIPGDADRTVTATPRRRHTPSSPGGGSEPELRDPFGDTKQ